MTWFGQTWGAPVCVPAEHVNTPIGERCGWCEEPIDTDDQGVFIPHLGKRRTVTSVPHHLDCHMRSIVGGYNHQLGLCTCCGGALPPDPPDLTKREAARWASDYFSRHGVK